tara:strand:- start:4889 stop:5212 length:324 start_codon:yes stop_codon:yes gene_type:complete
MTDFNYVKLPSDGATPRQVAFAVNLLIDGKFNSTGSVTLTASAASTAVTDYRAGPDSVILFTPTTANAAAEQGGGTMYLSARAKQGFTITHANNSQTDRTFLYIVIG